MSNTSISTLARLEENLAATRIGFSADELAAIEAIAPQGVAAGARYSEVGMRQINR